MVAERYFGDMFGFSSLSHFSRYVQTNLEAKPSDFRE